MKKKIIIIINTIIVFMLSICIYTSHTKSDTDLNRELYYDIAHDSEYLEYYKTLFENEDYNLNLKMGLDWFVLSYDDVYTHKTKTFYSNAFDTPSTSTNKLLNLYNSDNKKYHYLKPYLDCYLLLDEEDEVDKEELEKVKSTILYAIDFYINGVDFEAN